MAEEYKRPGWYADPEGKPGERWWNGSSWSDTRRGGSATPVPPVAYAPSPPAPPRVDPYATTLPGSIPAPPTAAPRPAFSMDARSNRPALVGLVVGLVSLFAIPLGGPVAVVFSILGIVKARQLTAAGSGGTTIVLATVGLICGIIATVVLLISVVAFVASISYSYGS